MDGSAVLIALGSAVCVALGWGVSSFVGSPVRKFFDLRGEIIRRLTEFANVRARYKVLPDGSLGVGGLEELGQISDPEIARLEEAQRTLRDLASQMRAFAENEALAAWVVRRLYDPIHASAGLIGLSRSYDTYGKDRAFHRETVVKALRIKL